MADEVEFFPLSGLTGETIDAWFGPSTMCVLPMLNKLDYQRQTESALVVWLKRKSRRNSRGDSAFTLTKTSSSKRILL